MDVKNIGVLMTGPMMPYLRENLETKFTVYKLWEAEDQQAFVGKHSDSIRAVACSPSGRAINAEIIDALPKLETVSTFSVGLDNVDLVKCKERGIAVTNTPDVLTDDVADLALGLMLSALRQISAADRYVRQGMWPKAEYGLTSKVRSCSVFPFTFSLSRIKTIAAFRIAGQTDLIC